MRIVFMGSPDFACPTLHALHQTGHDIVCVYTQPPKPAGRGLKLRETAVHVLAKKLDLLVLTPEKFSSSEASQQFCQHHGDVAIVCAYGLLLPQIILQTPRLGCINVHASFLPRWRGAAPIERAILAGDETTGITIMQMNEGLDCGDILAHSSPVVIGEKTARDLHQELAQVGAELCVKVLQDLHENTLKSPQDESLVTYAHKLQKHDAAIDWQQPSHLIAAQIRGLAMRGGAWCYHGKERLKIHAARPHPDPNNAPPGTIIDRDQALIACAQGSLQILQAQCAGGVRAAASEVFSSLDLTLADRLENGTHSH
ncbi:MAG: methionyl-tRNA formyltransferase [Pseudomonadota bacterium]